MDDLILKGRMMVQAGIFFGVAFVAFIGALVLVFHRHPVMASLGMALAMVALGAVYAMLHVPFLGLFQMIVNAGAVMVIVLYVIMALGQEELGPRVGKVQTALTYVAVLLLLGQVYFAIIRSGAGSFPRVGRGFGSIQAFGDLLVSEYAVPFEIASLLLVGAMVGAVVLSRSKWS